MCVWQLMLSDVNLILMNLTHILADHMRSTGVVCMMMYWIFCKVCRHYFAGISLSHFLHWWESNRYWRCLSRYVQRFLEWSILEVIWWWNRFSTCNAPRNVFSMLGTITSHGFLSCGFLPIRIAFPVLSCIVYGPTVSIPTAMLLKSFEDYLTSYESGIVKGYVVSEWERTTYHLHVPDTDDAFW